MNDEELYSSGIFTSELDEEDLSGADIKEEDDPFEDDDIDDDLDDDIEDGEEDYDDDDDPDGNYNPLEDYSKDGWE